MEDFKKGDVLRGTKKGREESYHPIVFISGPDEVPLAVVLTHADDFSCNFKLSGEYAEKASYFIAHLIQKMSEWGPYKKVGELTKEDLELIESHISGLGSITWSEYKTYTKNACPDHQNTNAREGSL